MPGVVITEVRSGSPAALASLRVGDVIQQVNRNPVHNAEEFRQALDEAPERGQVLLLVRGKQYSRFVVLQLGD